MEKQRLGLIWLELEFYVKGNTRNSIIHFNIFLLEEHKSGSLNNNIKSLLQKNEITLTSIQIILLRCSNFTKVWEKQNFCFD